MDFINNHFGITLLLVCIVFGVMVFGFWWKSKGDLDNFKKNLEILSIIFAFISFLFTIYFTQISYKETKESNEQTKREFEHTLDNEREEKSNNIKIINLKLSNEIDRLSEQVNTLTEIKDINGYYDLNKLNNQHNEILKTIRDIKSLEIKEYSKTYFETLKEIKQIENTIQIFNESINLHNYNQGIPKAKLMKGLTPSTDYRIDLKNKIDEIKGLEENVYISDTVVTKDHFIYFRDAKIDNDNLEVKLDVKVNDDETKFINREFHREFFVLIDDFDRKYNNTDDLKAIDVNNQEYKHITLKFKIDDDINDYKLIYSDQLNPENMKIKEYTFIIDN
ncbi:hypothetical protein BFS35_005705 [Macrococcoides goetzii]|uniref:Uncharacterized protein n=1 Tax=Macrococcoides goetzii TaxID=1891097 RepID=A0A395GAG2_9STAP|nr:hypothetical protein [Macrococcus goetzii]RAI81059.1 hypothetical protein BFS35_005705 [Macrococcus goetzii]